MRTEVSTSERQVSVLVVTTSFPTKQNPASGIFVKRFVDNLPSNLEISVLTPCGCDPDAFPLDPRYKLKCFRYGLWEWQKLAHTPGGVPAVLENNLFLKFLLPVFLVSMALCCMKEIPRADIIHANWSINGFICAWAKLFTGKPMVLTLRGADVTKSETSRFYKSLLRFAMRSSQVVTVVSEAMYQRLIMLHPDMKQKLTVVPNGVDNELLEIPVRSLNLKKGLFNVLVVGSLINRKNLPVVLKAVASLRGRLEIRLTIVGEGPEKRSLELLCDDLGIAECVEFAGTVAPEHISVCLKQADCMVLASSREGKPNVILEAFASGLPVIASNIDGVKEMIGNSENGLLFESGNEKELADKLEELLRDESLYGEFSKNGKEYILQNNLQWRDTGRQYASIYKNLTEVI